MSKRLPWGHQSRQCIYCGRVGAAIDEFNGVGWGHGTDGAARQRKRVPPVAGWVDGPGSHTAVAHARDKGDAKTFRGGGKYTGGRERTADVVERDSAGNAPPTSTTRNRRSVWTIATQPFSAAHFATFPEALVEPCVLAGSRPGDVVFDPFMGSGTVAQVAQRLGRRWLGCELNPEYVALQADRTREMGLAL